MMAGDEDAFASLYRRRHGAVYRFALQMSGSPSIAEDVTQEVFMVLMRDGGRFDPARGSLSAYLFGIARNHVLRRWDRERVYEAIADDDGEEAPLLGEPIGRSDPLAELTRRETIEAVRRAVLALPVHYREAVVLCDLHEVSYAEAAEVLGCAMGTVRSRLHRARAMLLKRLSGAGNGNLAANESAPEDPASPDPPLRTANRARCLA